MPRQKVLPRDRRRVDTACISCRMSKRRCDGQKPCHVCVRRGRPALCSYDANERQVMRDSGLARIPASSREGNIGAHIPVAHQDETIEVQAPRASLQDPGENNSRGHMFSNSRGEPVYINSLGGLSFARYLRSTFKERSSRYNFAEGIALDTVHDEIEHETPVELDDVVLDQTTRRELVESFQIVTSGFLDLFDGDELESFSSGNVARDSLQEAAQCLVFAIGAQSRATSCEDSRVGRSRFVWARSIAFQGQLENPCVDLIRVFILLAFYMVGASRRHAAVMHIGVATTAAVVLGLHQTEQYPEPWTRQTRMRWRVYKSLVNLDTVYGTLLGRHLLSPALTAGIPQTSGAFDLPHSPIAFTFSLCNAVRSVVGALASAGRLDAQRVEIIVAQLSTEAETWKQCQARDLVFPSSLPDLRSRSDAVGKFNASCIFYHLLVLITRPSLMASVTQSRWNSERSSSHLVDNLDKHARVCLDGCICAVATCYEFFEAGMVMNNMSYIIRPLLFEVGLILGFLLAIDPAGNPEVELRLRQARKILKRLARTAHLSRVFYDILSSILDAVVRRRADATNASSGGRAVGRLFQIQARTSISNDGDTPQNTGRQDGSLSQDVLQDNWIAGFQDQEWELLAQQFSSYFPDEEWTTAVGMGID